MDEARIEHIARVLCRAARIDPDAPTGPSDNASYYASNVPVVEGKPAWHRFRLAAENFCQARDFLCDLRPFSPPV
jgi:hypothetical protein